MNTLNSFRTCVFKKYADFQGKASRSEYWWFWGIYCLILFGCPLLAFIMEDCFNVRLYSLMFIWAIGTFGLICPFIAVSVRRLHDSGLSGWHFLWRFIPLIGSIVTFFLMIRKSMTIVENKTSDNSSSYVASKSSSIFKKLGLSLLIILTCILGCASELYFPFYIILGIYYIRLVWKKKPYNEGDYLMLPLLQKIGLYKDITDNYLLKKKLLTFAALVLGTIFMSVVTIILLYADDYGEQHEDICYGLLVFSILAWLIFFFHEYGIQWLNKGKGE